MAQNRGAPTYLDDVMKGNSAQLRIEAGGVIFRGDKKIGYVTRYMERGGILLWQGGKRTCVDDEVVGYMTLDGAVYNSPDENKQGWITKGGAVITREGKPYSASDFTSDLIGMLEQDPAKTK